jgi:hypothetical protein
MIFSRYVVCNLNLNGSAPFRGVNDRATHVLSTGAGKRAVPASISQPWKKFGINGKTIPGTTKEPLAPRVIERVNIDIGIR